VAYPSLDARQRMNANKGVLTGPTGASGKQKQDMKFVMRLKWWGKIIAKVGSC